jgi:N-acetylglucosamine kinase-like BadF-type ATPase
MYLGIVLHGEKIEFLLIDKLCQIHGYQKEHMVDFIDEPTNFKGVIESGIARVCLKASKRFDDIEFSCVAVPGYGENEVSDRLLRKYLSDIFYNGQFLCENEIEAAWISALAGHEGIVIMSGVGSIAMGKNKRDETVRTGGWGRLAGDEGGEYWLAKKILEIFTKESDGRYDKQGLYYLLKEKMALNHDADIYNFSFNYLDHFNLTFESFVDLLFEAATDDIYAKAAIEQCVEEYVLMIQSVENQLIFEKPTKVSYIGRIFEQPTHLTEMISQRIGEDYILQSPYLSLVSGAALRAIMFRRKINFYEIHQLLKEESRLHHLTK